GSSASLSSDTHTPSFQGSAVTSTRVCGLSSTRPSVSSCLTASRTGMGLTPYRSASRENTRRAPGCRCPCTISSFKDSYTYRVLVLTWSPRSHRDSGPDAKLPRRSSRTARMLPPEGALRTSRRGRQVNTWHNPPQRRSGRPRRGPSMDTSHSRVQLPVALTDSRVRLLREVLLRRRSG